MDITEKSIDDIKAMTDADELRKAVGDIEREIKSLEYDDDDMPKNDPMRILLHGNSIETPTGERGERLHSLLALRREALNQMFRATHDEMALFAKINNYLTTQTAMLTQRAAALYRAMLGYRDIDFDDQFETRGEMHICRLARKPLPIDDYYGSDFGYMTELIRLITYCDSGEPMLRCVVRANRDNTPDKEDDELAEVEIKGVLVWEKDSIFDCGRLAETFRDMEICDAARELCRPSVFSLPDLLHVEEVLASSCVECRHWRKHTTSDLLYDLEYDIINRDEELVMWKHIGALSDDDIYSVKLPVTNAEVYLYATNNEAALLMVDSYTDTELADEKPFDDDLPQYFGTSSHRISPVYYLCSLAKEWQENPALQKIRIKCFLLTSTSICNYEDMDGEWKQLGVKVRHELKAINHDLTVNNREDAISYFPDISDFVSKERAYEMDIVKINDDDSSDSGNDDTDEESDLRSWLNEGLAESSSAFPNNGNVPNEMPPVRVLKYERDSQAKLDSLVGLDDIKQHIKDMVLLSQYNHRKMEIHPELKPHLVNLHSIFSGPIGVGKTTVAQLYSSLLRDAHVLSRGHMVICDRGTFIGKLWGDEERRVNQVIKMAQGGVLFIDEAYTLASSHPNDPGRLVLPMMLNLLADETQRDIAVVLAGYEKPMESLLSLNPGLASRFANRFHFKPFTLNELLEIAQLKNAPYGYNFTNDAKAAFKKMVAEAFSTKGSSFSNGRFIANLLEKTYIRHATRCMTNGILDDEMLNITFADIPEKYDLEDEHYHMGFR